MDVYNKLQVVLEKLPGRDVNILKWVLMLRWEGVMLGYEDVIVRLQKLQ